MFSDKRKRIVDKLDSMSVSDARKAIASGEFGEIGLPDHFFALNYLSTKEADLRDSREAETLRIASSAKSEARRANIIAIIAAIAAIIAAIWPICGTIFINKNP